jgi:hypothetical protein
VSRLQALRAISALSPVQSPPQHPNQITARPDDSPLSIESTKHSVTQAARRERQRRCNGTIKRGQRWSIPAKDHDRIMVTKSPAQLPGSRHVK